MLKRPAPQALVNSVIGWFPCIRYLTGAFVAGGFIRAYYAGERPNDMDLCFRDEESFETSSAFMEKYRSDEWNIVFSTDRAVTYQNKDRLVQFIKFAYGEPEDLVADFDFTICAVALELELVWNSETNWVATEYMHERFFEDLAGRVLVYLGSRMPLASLKRVIKYVKRGYHICDENLISIAESIAILVNFSDKKSVEEHIQGMDPEGGRRVRVID